MKTSAALYELRTSGPEATKAKPIARPSRGERIEPLRLDEAVDRRVLRRRAQVLAERDDVDPGLAQIAHRLEHLVVRLADADHDASSS